MTRAALILSALVALVGCEPDKPVVGDDDGGPARRVPEPSESNVQALDHEIHSKGIGPYLLGASLGDTLAKLPHGPRIELVQVDVVADVRFVPAEGGRILVGVRKPSGVEFLSVLDKDIARTEQEAGVGTRVAELPDKHGPLLSRRSFVSDPRIWRPASIPGLQFVHRRGTVEAVVVTRPPPEDAKRPGPACKLDEVDLDRKAIAAVARVGGAPMISVGCFTGSEPEALVAGDGRVAVVSLADKPRRLVTWAAPGLVYAAALEVDGDQRDEVFAVFESRTPATLEVTVDVLEVRGSRLVSLERQRVYKLESSSPRWARARLSDVELLIEARARGGLVTVAGLYVHNNLLEAEEVLPLEPVPLVVRQRRPANGTEAGPDAGPSSADAGPPPSDGGRGK